MASRESGLLFCLERGPGIALQVRQEKKVPWSETGMLGNFGVASRVPSSISNFKMECVSLSPATAIHIPPLLAHCCVLGVGDTQLEGVGVVQEEETGLVNRIFRAGAQ